MRELENSKEYYDNIDIPEELDSIVGQTIKESTLKRKIKHSGTQNNIINMHGRNRKNHKRLVMKMVISIGSVVAALLLTMLIGINTNQAFAQEMSKIPVIGAVIKVLSVNSYEKQKENVNISVDVPEVEVLSNGFVADVNAEIRKVVDEYVKNAENEIEEYKEAFLATGGTGEQWSSRGIQVNVSYDIKYQDSTKVSFVLKAYENWVNYSEERTYYNLDLKNNKKLTLADILGDDYVNIANTQISKQIDDRTKTTNGVYWGFGEDKIMGDVGFKSVDEGTTFYINEKGNVMVTFEKYAIGPGYIGVQEFEILN